MAQPQSAKGGNWNGHGGVMTNTKNKAIRADHLWVGFNGWKQWYCDHDGILHREFGPAYISIKRQWFTNGHEVKEKNEKI
jgi:hypothetical protein